jgi:RNA polymerase sigma-70 factor (ECF subfamily)
MSTYNSLNTLIEHCLNGDRKAQFALYNQYSSLLFAICKRYTPNPDDAAEVLQLGFIKIFTKMSDFKKENSFEGWMRTIMVHTALDFIRKRQKTSDLFVKDPEIEISDYLVNDAISRLSTDELLIVVSRLPEGYRLVFNLIEIEGYSHKEVSEILQISIGSSKSQLSRAKAHLRNLIARSTNEFANYQSQQA